MPDGPTPFPSVERARAEGCVAPAVDGPLAGLDLLEREPLRTTRLAAVLVSGSLFRREAWSDDVQLTAAVLEQIRAVRVPAERSETRSYRTLDPAVPVRESRCDQCAVLGGRVPCGVCPYPLEDEGPCRVCGGAKSLVCAACGGTTKMFRARVDYVTETLVPFRRLVMPELLPRLSEPLSRALQAEGPPAGHGIDDEAVAGRHGDPYRGARAAADFHGWAYGPALDRARQLVTRVTRLPSVVEARLALQAWPLLWLTFGAVSASHHAVVVVTADGSSRAVVV